MCFVAWPTQSRGHFWSGFPWYCLVIQWHSLVDSGLSLLPSGYSCTPRLKNTTTIGESWGTITLGTLSHLTKKSSNVYIGLLIIQFETLLTLTPAFMIWCWLGIVRVHTILKTWNSSVPAGTTRFLTFYVINNSIRPSGYFK